MSKKKVVAGAVAVFVLLGAIGAANDGPASTPTPSPGVPSAEPSPAATAPASAAPSPEPSSVSATPLASEAPLGSAPLGQTETATVVRVIDGDTIEVDRGNGPERVRYIGVDTPETVAPGSPIEWMGPEASAANKTLVEGQVVRLERDISETDRYGRLLRYVWVEDQGAESGWLLVNLALVAEGYAQVSTYPPDVRYVELYLEAQHSAEATDAGLWASQPMATPDPTPKATPKPTPKPTPKAAPKPTPRATTKPKSSRAGCDPSYPGVCIPPAPPDLDCRDIPFRRFDVVGRDPHGFDGDNDGIGCESG